MTRRIVVFTALVCFACYGYGFASGQLSFAAPSSQLPGRGDSADHGSIVCVEVTFADGYTQAVPDGCDLVPATATAPPAYTSTPTPTATIEPTYPWPTFTPTNTPGWAPTPTQETTPLPTPGPADCLMRVKADALPWLNIRETPGGTIIGRAYPGDYLKPEGKTTYNGVVWLLVYGDEDRSGFVHSGYVEPVEGYDCSGYVVRDVRAGPHVLMGEGASVVEQYAAGISAAKCLPGSYQICQHLKEANPDIWIIARPFTDHIATQYHFNPLLAWDAVSGAVPAGFDALELENESTPPDDRIDAWVQFSIGLAQLVAHDTGMQYLAFSFGPGNPPYELWPRLLPYLEWVSANPLPDGRYHGIAIHAAPYATFTRPDMPWVNAPHLAGRIYLARDVLLANTGFDLATWPGLLTVTEIGLADGYSGDWDATYTCAEAADAYQTTADTYQSRGYPQVEIWWSFGAIGMWHSDAACAGVMFG